MSSFWTNLPKPFYALAPMANVTDAALRRIIAKQGKPDVLFTEFVSVDGLADPQGRTRLLYDFIYSEAERPIVAQIFGGKPELFASAARLIAELGFDGIDINMGCPDRAIMKQGSCAALINDPARACAIIHETKQGAGTLPVSVKTRLGVAKNSLNEWLPRLLESELAAVTIHARTAHEQSLVPAKWNEIARAVEIAKGSGTLIIGNGDVRDLVDAEQKVCETGCDGVMLGRAIFGNPWLFANPPHAPSIEEKMRVLLEHADLFDQLLGRVKNFAIMRKHIGAYVKNFDGAKELRMQLMEAKSAAEPHSLLVPILKEDVNETCYSSPVE